ncbi:Saccharopine dehydrogenase / Homospermidine synthase [Kalmanozyma brasiliensis GHG001]|uniref:Saccharopine dehydrogenase n=1 Tax=Kalmanozyma brasiliensis (strain GHG001) TaxID=1365824 RepID=V5GTZ6_KALBG|nr:Saccharopine dehydrogenase / Homospermidine synthase [Kalmanozyma brasiliensis GHG001]EST09382.1 Saccharopine dehydrogenase / Homospermidine synthase [Kalmanozyma brasiliensis GHG001]
MSQKQYDLVVFGATGYTGKLVCKYLLSHPEKRSWAVAGRSASRLSSLKSDLGLPSSVGVIEAETSKYASLTAMTAQAKVLINIVGPYRPFKASEVVRACVETGTHYVDLSGETGFNKDIIDEFHLAAQAKGVTVSSSVGFDSLPFDLTTYLAAQKVKQLTGGKSDVKLAECAYDLPESLSAGTLASAIAMASEKEQMFSVRGDWLSPIAKPDALSFNTVRWFPQRQRWGAQNTFSIHNTRMVNRTWGLLEHHHSPQSYGKAFLYKEGTIVPFKLAGILLSYMNAISIWFLMNFALVRSLAAKSMPANSGPSEKSLVNNRMKVETVATANDGTKAICRMKAKGHAGYLLTARMIVETALTIIDDKGRKQNPFEKAGVQGGVLTPALVGAERLAERLVEFSQFEITTEKFDENEVKKTK